jgi:hypothetical protein
MKWIRVTRWILAAGGVAFVLAAAWLSTLPRQAARPVSATVTWIGPSPSALPYGPDAVVVARTDDGRTGRMTVPAHQLRCKIGDRIRATRRGVSVHLDQSSCASLGRYD